MQKIYLTETKLTKLINKTVQKILREGQGVVENGMKDFAEYLWQRCSKILNNYMDRFNKMGECNFTISSKQFNKYNTYNLNCDKVQVTVLWWNNRHNFAASFGLYRGIPQLTITMELISAGHDAFVKAIMHELTHFVNHVANAKDGTSLNDRKYDKIRRIAAMPNSEAGEIEYLYNRTEMNARLTEAYYFLKNSDIPNMIKDLKEQDGWIDKQELMQWIFEKISGITKYNAMSKQLSIVFKDTNYVDAYAAYIQRLRDHTELSTSTFSPITAHLKYGKSVPNKEHSIGQYYKRRFDMAFFMQKELEKFRKRIYKMIYKFITEIL